MGEGIFVIITRISGFFKTFRWKMFKYNIRFFDVRTLKNFVNLFKSAKIAKRDFFYLSREVNSG